MMSSTSKPAYVIYFPVHNHPPCVSKFCHGCFYYKVKINVVKCQFGVAKYILEK
jgi:hypothetical protein